MKQMYTIVVDESGSPVYFISTHIRAFELDALSGWARGYWIYRVDKIAGTCVEDR